MTNGHFTRLAPARPHECPLPGIVPSGEAPPPGFPPGVPWPLADRLPRTDDEWQCGDCDRVYRYQDGGWFVEGRWKLIRATTTVPPIRFSAIRRARDRAAARRLIARLHDERVNGTGPPHADETVIRRWLAR